MTVNPVTTQNIFLFVPNLIGYARVILAIISFYFMPTNHVVACFCYLFSVLLDAFDGHAARIFNQNTKFGAMLDQLTDRCGTMSLLIILTSFYPPYKFWFIISIAIDISCHWIFLHTSVLQGRVSHKFIDLSSNPIMSAYYSNKIFLFSMCAGNEAFYCALYLLHFSRGCIFAGIGLFEIVAYLTAPIALIKTLISLVHGFVACKNLSIIDAKEREVTTTISQNIFLFVPNIIGYARVVLAIVSFYFMPINHMVACFCYVFSALLDAFDGHAARIFNQSTKFGAMLDQLTDRCGTMGLLVILCNFYPEYMFWFILSIAIDISCHWIFLHTSVLQGRASHKFVDLSSNPIMSIYYTNKTVLFIMCAGNEAFYAALYLLYFTNGPLIAGIGLFKIVAFVSAPIAFIKTILSLIHGFVACKNLSIIDLKERERNMKKAE